MSARYLVRLKNQQGKYVAIFDQWLTLNFTHRANEVGICRFEFDGNDERKRLFQIDGQLEIWRRDISANLEWYIEWEGFVRTFDDKREENGEARYIVYASSYLDLISRRQIGYYANVAQTSKAGPAESVIKQFVRENAGAQAVSPPRLRNGVFPNFTVQADFAQGPFWTGNRAWKPLLDTIRDIGNERGIDFDVIGRGDAKFEFLTYLGQRGVDRSMNGYDPETGRNAAGNLPVIFSLRMGNMNQPEVIFKHTDEVNAVFVLGQGQNEERNVVVRENPTGIATSPWNDVELTRSTQETFLPALQAIGDQVLNQFQAEQTFAFQVLDLQNRVYGRDFHWGDLVSAEYNNVMYNKKIVGVDITVSAQGTQNPEQIKYIISDNNAA